jgi:hypothetical protein
MSQTIPPVITIQKTDTPETDSVLKNTQSLLGLVVQTEANPIVKAKLEAQYDTISHSASAPIILAVAGLIGAALAQQHIAVDDQLIAVAIGALMTGAAYAWQWISMKINKPVVTK